MNIKLDIDRVDAHLGTLDRSRSAFEALYDYAQRFAGYGVDRWCGEVAAKVIELQTVTSNLIAFLKAVRTQTLAADHLGLSVGSALGHSSQAALVALVRSVFESQLLDRTVDELIDWAQEHAEWLPDLADLIPFPDAEATAEIGRRLDPATLVSWWANAAPTIRRKLIDEFPDLAAAVLRAGGQLSNTELDALRRAITYTTSISEQFVGYEALIPTTKIDLGLAGELTIMVEFLSDGTALVHVLGDQGFSGVVAGKAITTSQRLKASADAAVGLGLGGFATFKFDSGESAVAAIERVKQAAVGAITAALSDALPDWLEMDVRLGPRSAAEGLDAVMDELDQFGQRLDSVEVALSESAIALADGSITGLALSGELGVEATRLRADQIGGDEGDYDGARITLSGSATVNLDRPWFLPGDGVLIDRAGGGEGSVELRIYKDGHEEVVVTGSYWTTPAGNGSARKAQDVTITLPVDDDTRAAVKAAINDVADGVNPLERLGELGDRCHIEVRTTAISEHSSKTGLFGNNVITGDRESQTESIQRRSPGGGWYSPIDLANQIEQQAG